MTYEMKLKGAPKTPKTVTIDQMEPGQIGRITTPGFRLAGDIVLRVYGALVSLTNPNSTWTLGNGKWELDVELLPEGYVIEITPGRAVSRP